MSASSRKKVLFAPLSGVVVPLEQVPDPVFAEKMAGDGIALLPSSRTLKAPCDGTVTQLHAASHALTLTSREGLQILLHVGVETVRLNGRGFAARVSPGDAVRTGDPLIDVDLAYLEQAAPSALTMMVIANGEMVESCLPAGGGVEAGISPALELVLREGNGASLELCASGRNSGGAVRSSPILIRNPQGLHARPAAVLAGSAKRFASEIRLVKFETGLGTGPGTGAGAGEAPREANAKSITSLMLLDVKHHDRVSLKAEGPDAGTALKALAPLLESGLGESAAAERDAPEETRPGRPVDASVFRGLPVSPGLASGVIFQWRRHGLEAPEHGAGVASEERALAAALDAARKELDSLQGRLRGGGEADKAAIFEAHGEILDDPELLRAVELGISAGQSAAFAWQKTFAAQADLLGGMDNAVLAGRAADIRDVGRRVLSLLTGTARRTELPRNVIVVAAELTPSEAAGMDAESIRGLCTTTGGAASHASLLARSMGIPAVAGLEERALFIPDGSPAVIDGSEGELRLHPDERELLRVRAAREAAAKAGERQRPVSSAAVTADGGRVRVAANIGSLAEAGEAVRQGGDGVGLLRSEFLFLRQTKAPSEEEQAGAYRAIAETLGQDLDFVARTLDVGGDKPLAYLPLPPESNPFLGLRGIRLNLLSTEAFTIQVRAMLRAASLSRLRIMFPMISSVEELRAARRIVDREKAALGITTPVPVGIMVEVPAAALLAENLAAEADFFSIGTNDLAQYTLAVDRGHPRLAGMADELHPAVLRLIAMTVEGARKLGKRVGVCGGLAGDPVAVPLLLGLGVDELSVGVGAIPAIKSLIRKQSLERCRILAADALCMLTAAEVRRYLEVFPTEAG